MNTTNQNPVVPGGFPDSEAVIIIRILVGVAGQPIEGDPMIESLFTLTLGRLIQKVVEATGALVECPVFAGPIKQSLFIFGLSAGPGGEPSVERALAALSEEMSKVGLLPFSTIAWHIPSQDAYRVHYPAGGTLVIPTVGEIRFGLEESKRVMAQAIEYADSMARAYRDLGNKGGPG